MYENIIFVFSNISPKIIPGNKNTDKLLLVSIMFKNIYWHIEAKIVHIIIILNLLFIVNY